MSNYDEHGNWVRPQEWRTLTLYPHHCAPEDVAALVQRLESLADPAQQPTPSYENTDWRGLAGVCARVIKYLSGDDWRHGA